jgi:hypothetical protein
MQYIEDHLFTKDILKTLDKSNYPLTFDMCFKNEFSSDFMVRFLLNQEISSPLGVVIYKIVSPTEIRIYSLEIHNNFRLQQYGRKLLNLFKETYSTIILSTLPESKLFYLKQDFVEQEENRLIWSK